MMENLTIPQCPAFTLDACLDEYMAHRGIDKKKYFARYLIVAKRVWQDLFFNTLYVVKNEWRTIQAGEPYNYVDVPKDCVRLFSVNTVDKHNKIQELFYNSQLNVIPPPAQKKCGCTKCECGGTCEDLNSTITTTKLVFTINGTNYYETDWIKYCSNGDVLLWRNVPVKKYNNFAGDGGDYNFDYMDDFLIGAPPFADFSIVYQAFQEKICALTVYPCGCPQDTPDNHKLIDEYCSCFLPAWGHFRRNRENKNLLFDNINNNFKGEVKLSDCGTRIYYKPSNHHHENIIPDFLLISYQTSGLSNSIDEQVIVPEYCINAMFAGIDYRSKKFNNAYSLQEKTMARYEYNDEVNNIIKYLNPLSFDWMQNVSDAEIKF